MPLIQFPVYLLFLVLLHGKFSRCESTEFPLENVCYWNNTFQADEECPEERKREIVTYFRNGSSSGVIIAEVMLPWCDYISFHVILIDEKRRDGFCTNGKRSWRTYRRIECQSGECSNKCANVTNFIFYQVYPSLYSLTVLAYNKKNEFIDYRSKPVEIKTDYTRSWRTDITYENPTFERDVVNFQVTFEPPTSDVAIYLKDKEDNNNDKISFEVFNSTVNAALQLKGYHEDLIGGHDIVMKVCSITQEKQDTRHKGWLGGQHFETEEELKNSIISWFNSQAAGFYAEGLKKLSQPYEKFL